MDTHYPDAVLIAEANQPPAETMQFYGKGERFHMVFNFPVMPRLYQALALADATPVYSILDELPQLPEAANGVPSCATTMSSPWRWWTMTCAS